MLPAPAGLMLQVSPVLLVPETVGLNCCVCVANKLALPGVIETATGCSVTIELADCVGSATLVAVTVTVCVAEIVPGAVYKPDSEMLPTGGVSVQVTDVFPVPTTV